MLDITQAWFCYEDHVGQPRASVTTFDLAADEVNQSPVAHVRDRYLYRAWQSPTNADWFEIDFGADVSLQCLTVIFPRITNPYRKFDQQEIAPSDTVRHRIDADGGTPGTGAVLDTGAVACGALPTRGYSVAALQTPVTGRYWRCEINAPSRATDNFFLVGLAFAGPIFQPAFNHIYGDRIAFPDNAETQRTPGSQTAFVTRNERTLKAVLTWDFIEDDERSLWEAMTDYAGTTEPFIFASGNKTSAAFVSVTGPSGWIIAGDKVFASLLDEETGLTGRQLDANIKQIQMTEHR